MANLVELMRQCQADTQQILGVKVAARLAQWQQYEADPERLVQFIKERITGESRENGWRLANAGRISLESIAVDYFPELFADVIAVAKATLGRA